MIFVFFAKIFAKNVSMTTLIPCPHSQWLRGHFLEASCKTGHKDHDTRFYLTVFCCVKGQCHEIFDILSIKKLYLGPIWTDKNGFAKCLLAVLYEQIFTKYSIKYRIVMSSRTLLVSWQHGVTPSVDLNKLKTTNNTLTVQLFFYLQNHRTFHSEESWST